MPSGPTTLRIVYAGKTGSLGYARWQKEAGQKTFGTLANELWYCKVFHSE